MNTWLAGLMTLWAVTAQAQLAAPVNAGVTPKAHVQAYPGLGRLATAQEIAAWDIDVRPDFKGLPPGSGSVAQGQDIWEAKCAHCHGVFGESNEVFSPLIGGTTKKDIETGRVANLIRSDYPGRTTLMKVPTVSSLWDYINRAMPWTSPKSLKPDEVYAVTAFMLSLADIVPDDFVLNDKNIAEVQKRMPNRNGMQTRHAMWPGKEFGGTTKPDTNNVACMRNCATEPKLSSFLPEFARNNHGNLRDQNRLIGPQRGANTVGAESSGFTAGVALATSATSPMAVSANDEGYNPAARLLIQKNGCLSCHAIDRKVVGPSFADVGQKHAGKVEYLASKIKSGGQGVWGAIPMPPQSLADADARAIAAWLASGAVK